MTEKLVKIFKALGDNSRLRIVNMLSRKPLCVCEVTSILNLSQSTVSGHLRALKKAGLAADRKDGLWVEYYLDDNNPLVKEILAIAAGVLSEDPAMAKDKEMALKADRNVICKK